MKKSEIFRKLTNLFAIFIPIVYYFVPSSYAKIVLLFLTLGLLTIDLLRLKVNLLKDAFVLLFGSFMRKHEIWSINGVTYLMLGALLSVLLFPKMIAIAAVSYVVVGDTFAAVFGIPFGKIKLFKKSLVGSLAFFISSAAIALLLAHLPEHLELKIALIGAGAATIIEALPWNIDDNFAVPLIAGAIMKFLS